jgi:hypothetical protein
MGSTVANMWANVGIPHGGVCAFAAGTATKERVKVSARKIVNAVAILFLSNFFSSPNLVHSF